MNEIVVTMITLCVVTVIGYIARKLDYFNESFSKKLSTLVIDICCPSLILSSVMGDTLPESRHILPLLGVSILSYVLLTILAILLPKLYVKNVADRGLFGFMIIFGNVAFIGYPVCHALFGSEAVFYASILNFPNTLFVFTIGVSLITGNMDEGKRFDWKVLLCPGCIASYISMLVVALGITDIHSCIAQPLRMIGNITVPASLLIIGASMADIPVRKMLGSREVYITALLRVAVVPLLMYVLFSFIPVNPLVRNINLVVLGMPVASFGTMLCLRYGRDTSLMTETTFVTTIASLFSIPLLSLLF